MNRDAEKRFNALGLDLEHIACISIATTDLESLLETYVDSLGFEITEEVQESPRGFGLRWVEVGHKGKTLFEIMEPTGQGGPVDRFLERNPSGGVYQIRLHVNDLQTVLERLRHSDVQVIEGKDVDGWPRTGWIHPRSSGGVLIELVEDALEREAG